MDNPSDIYNILRAIAPTMQGNRTFKVTGSSDSFDLQIGNKSLKRDFNGDVTRMLTWMDDVGIKTVDSIIPHATSLQKPKVGGAGYNYLQSLIDDLNTSIGGGITAHRVSVSGSNFERYLQEELLVKDSAGKAQSMYGFMNVQDTHTSVLRIFQGDRELTTQEIINAMKKTGRSLRFTKDGVFDNKIFKRLQLMFNAEEFAGDVAGGLKATVLGQQELKTMLRSFSGMPDGLSDKALSKMADKGFDGLSLGNPYVIRSHLQSLTANLDLEIKQLQTALQTASGSDMSRIRGQIASNQRTKSKIQSMITKLDNGKSIRLEAFRATGMIDSQTKNVLESLAKGDLFVPSMKAWDSTVKDTMSSLFGISTHGVGIIASNESLTQQFSHGVGKSAGSWLSFRPNEVGGKVRTDVQALLAVPGLMDETMISYNQDLINKQIQALAEGKIPAGFIESLKEAINEPIPANIPPIEAANRRRMQARAQKILQAVDSAEAYGQNPLDSPDLFNMMKQQIKEQWRNPKGKGDPYLMMPNAGSGHIGNRLFAHLGGVEGALDLKPGEVMYGKDFGWVMHEYDIPRVSEAHGGFDLDDLVRLHTRAINKDGKRAYIGIGIRPPTGLGESTVYSVKPTYALARELAKGNDKIQFTSDSGKTITGRGAFEMHRQTKLKAVREGTNLADLKAQRKEIVAKIKDLEGATDSYNLATLSDLRNQLTDINRTIDSLYRATRLGVEEEMMDMVFGDLPEADPKTLAQAERLMDEKYLDDLELNKLPGVRASEYIHGLEKGDYEMWALKKAGISLKGKTTEEQREFAISQRDAVRSFEEDMGFIVKRRNIQETIDQVTEALRVNGTGGEALGYISGAMKRGIIMEEFAGTMEKTFNVRMLIDSMEAMMERQGVEKGAISVLPIEVIIDTVTQGVAKKGDDFLISSAADIETRLNATLYSLAEVLSRGDVRINRDLWEDRMFGDLQQRFETFYTQIQEQMGNTDLSMSRIFLDENDPLDVAVDTVGSQRKKAEALLKMQEVKLEELAANKKFLPEFDRLAFSAEDIARGNAMADIYRRSQDYFEGRAASLNSAIADISGGFSKGSIFDESWVQKQARMQVEEFLRGISDPRTGNVGESAARALAYFMREHGSKMPGLTTDGPLADLFGRVRGFVGLGGGDKGRWDIGDLGSYNQDVYSAYAPHIASGQQFPDTHAFLSQGWSSDDSLWERSEQMVDDEDAAYIRRAAAERYGLDADKLTMRAVADETSQGVATTIRKASEHLGKLWDVPIVKKGVVGAVGLAAFSFMYQATKDRTPEELEGPPLLPGGSFYEGSSGPQYAYPDNSYVPSYGKGVTYKIQAKGSFDANAFSSMASAITGGSSNLTTYNSRPRTQPDPFSEIGGMF